MQDYSPCQNGEIDGSNTPSFQQIASGLSSQPGDNSLVNTDESLGGRALASAQVCFEPGVTSDNICYGMVRFSLPVYIKHLSLLLCTC